MTIFLTLINSP